MDPTLQSLLWPAFVSMTTGLAVGGVLGGLAGLLPGGAVWTLGRARGWWALGPLGSAWARGRASVASGWLALLVWLFLGATGGGVLGAAVGAWRGGYQALVDSPVGQEHLPALGRTAADVVAVVTWWSDEVVDPAHPPLDPSSLMPPLAAFRAGESELPLADVRAAQDRLVAALRGPDHVEVARRLQAAVGEALPPSLRQGSLDGVSQVVDAVRGGPRSAGSEVLLVASGQLDAAAAPVGRADALSREELTSWALDGVILPATTRWAQWVLAGLVAVAEVVVVGVGVGHLLALWALRRVLSRSSPGAEVP